MVYSAFCFHCAETYLCRHSWNNNPNDKPFISSSVRFNVMWFTSLLTARHFAHINFNPPNNSCKICILCIWRLRKMRFIRVTKLAQVCIIGKRQWQEWVGLNPTPAVFLSTILTRRDRNWQLWVRCNLRPSELRLIILAVTCIDSCYANTYVPLVKWRMDIKVIAEASMEINGYGIPSMPSFGS